MGSLLLRRAPPAGHRGSPFRRPCRARTRRRGCDRAHRRCGRSPRGGGGAPGGLPGPAVRGTAAAAQRTGRLPRLRRRPRDRASAPPAPRRPGLSRRRPDAHRSALRLRPLAPAGGGGGQRARGRAGAGTRSDLGRGDRTCLRCRLPSPGPARRGAVPDRGGARPRCARVGRRAHAGDPDHVLGRLRRRGGGGQGAHPGRGHLPGRPVATLRSRPRRRAVRPLPGAAPGQSEPLPLFPAKRRLHGHRGVARAHGATARRHGGVAPDRRYSSPGGERAGGPAARRRAGRAPQGAGRARHARGPGLRTTTSAAS